jgi:GNAT superfamily N-acetyltransferase
MSIHMPNLEEGRIYRRVEVEAYIGNQTGTSDYDVAAAHFPRNLQTWETDFRGWRDGEEMVLQYQIFPLSVFKKKLWELESTFARHDEHQKRVEVIVKCLRRGEPVYPVFLQENDLERRIIEGNHRAVALLQLESHCLPAFLTGYRNWFEPSGPHDGFDREDEIVCASLQDVCGFFMHATCVDHKGRQLALFDGDRLRMCDEAFIARHREKTVGAVTVTVHKGEPTISTVYVLRQFRRKGVAYRLFEKALLRFQEDGTTEVFCDVQSPGMEAMINRLGSDRPELRALVKERIDYLPGEDIEMGFGED